MRKYFSGMLFLFFSCLTGCGYHAVNWESSPYAGAGKTVNINIFANKSYKPNLEGVLANSIVDEFARRKGLEPVSSDGDLTLSGEVSSYGLAAVSYSSGDVITEYSASMTVSATLRKSKTQQVLWKGAVTWNQTFPANNTTALQQNAEDAAVQEICRKIAQKLYLNMVNNF